MITEPPVHGHEFPCGCRAFLDHKQGDRKIECEAHSIEYVVRAVEVTTIEYEIKRRDGKDEGSGRHCEAGV